MSANKKIYPKLNAAVQLPEVAEGDAITMGDIYRELLHLKSYLTGRQANSAKPVFNNVSLSEYLGVSTRTLQNWRDEGKISFTQIKDVILYGEDDVESFMKKHKRIAFK